jgi:hypothetical protein
VMDFQGGGRLRAKCQPKSIPKLNRRSARIGAAYTPTRWPEREAMADASQ